MTKQELISKYDYRLKPWPEFVSDADLPKGLLARASELEHDDNSFVAYDTNDTAQGFLYIGEKYRQTEDYLINHIRETYNLKG